MSDGVLLELQDVHAHYSTSHVLHGVNLSARRGITAIVGRNGMGKTTLVRTIMGLVEASSGTIRLKGQDVSGRKPYEVARLGVGYVPQGRALFPSLSVEEHLIMLEARSREPDGWTKDKVFELFPRLEQRSKQSASSLSGGEQQMLAIGRALATNPSVLIMDEPSEGLAPVILDHLIDTCKSLLRSGITMILVEQNLHTATSLAEELHIMVSGQIVDRISSQTLMADRRARERYLGVQVRN